MANKVNRPIKIYPTIGACGLDCGLYAPDTTGIYKAKNYG